MAKSLKNLSKVLGIAQGYLRGLSKGNKVGKDDIIRQVTANCCRAIAHFTGYKNRKSAELAIRRNLNALYIPNDILARRIQSRINKYGKVKRQILENAISALKNNDFSLYNNLIKSDKDLKQKYRRKCAKTLKGSLIDALRSSEKPNRNTARRLLLAMKSPEGKQIVVPRQKFEKEVEKRLKRYGAVASLFWQSAKQLNPKIRPSVNGLGTLSKEKRKKHKMTNGMSYVTNVSVKESKATIKHKAELNGRFKKKLMAKIRQQQTWHAKDAQKRLLAAKYLDKLLENT